MPRLVALSVAALLPLTLTGCVMGSAGPSGAVRLEVLGVQPNAQEGDFRVEWQPRPDSFGPVTRSHNVYRWGSVPVGSYRLTVRQFDRTATQEVEVVEGETAELVVTLP